MSSRGRGGYRWLYRLSFAPWESRGLPPELSALEPPGRALELGCGRGNQAVELARRGWSVIGVDFAAEAVAAAARRARQAGVDAEFRVGDVTRLGESGLGGGFDLVYDIKCFHGLAPDLRAAYAAGVAAACRPGGDFVLFATQPSETRRRLGMPAGVSGGDVRATFSSAFELLESRHAPAHEPFGEAVYRFRRRPQ